MDGHQFDDLLRALSRSRRSLVGMALTAGGIMTGLTAAEAKKKKKKKCAKKCKDGCCTGKYGKCLKPAQQNSAQCGTGGEICRTNCGGGGDTCASTCEGCCAGNECIEVPTDDQCGNNGSACVPCVGEEICAGSCCIPPLKACSQSGTRCCGLNQCESGRCCVFNNGFCVQDSDCCDPANSTCEDNHCVVKLDMPCQPGWLCEGGLSCPAAGLCCVEPCGNTCCSGGKQCYGTVCCEPGFGCTIPNGGAGACCASEFCCVPENPGPGCQCEFDGCCG